MAPYAVSPSTLSTKGGDLYAKLIMCMKQIDPLPFTELDGLESIQLELKAGKKPYYLSADIATNNVDPYRWLLRNGAFDHKTKDSAYEEIWSGYVFCYLRAIVITQLEFWIPNEEDREKFTSYLMEGEEEDYPELETSDFIPVLLISAGKWYGDNCSDGIYCLVDSEVEIEKVRFEQLVEKVEELITNEIL